MGNYTGEGGGWLVVSSRRLQDLRPGEVFSVWTVPARKRGTLARLLGWFGVACWDEAQPIELMVRVLND